MAPLSPQQRRELDDAHSNRTIELDPSGYFLIRVDAAAGELVVQHFGNAINQGQPVVNRPFCKGGQLVQRGITQHRQSNDGACVGV